MKKSFAFRILISIIFLIAGLFINTSTIIHKDIISVICFFIAYFIVSYDILLEAIENIFKGKIFDENFLMTIATIGALIIKEFPEAIAVMLLYKIGECFQERAIENSKNAIKDLMKIKPEIANVKRNNEIVSINPADVKIGEIIVVKPGEKVPLDGKVLNGNSMLDTKTITGESKPKKITENEMIYSGSINLNSILEIEVIKKFEDSTVNKIIELVEEATSKKTKTENFITKFAKYYTPIVCLLALLLATIPPIIFKQEFINWIYRALIFLVISCPCALVISIPLGFFGGIGAASKKGILIKGSNYLEFLSKAKYIVFDKTGTLTEGAFGIQKIVPNGITEEELIRVVAHGEFFSNHPISIPIKEKYNNQYEESQIVNFEEITGKGIKATIFSKETLIGNEKLLKENNIEFEEIEEAGTVIYVAVGGFYRGYILISDRIKSGVKKSISNLKFIKKTYMFTGDDKKIAESIRKTLDIDVCKANLLPEQKLEALEDVIKSCEKGEKTIFVGDGINDSPCLARADIGIAMGAIGSDAAIDASDVVIMDDDISKISEAINISKKTMRIVKQNIIFALAVKLIVLILGAFGFANMWFAVFADVGVSIIAILNSIKILR